MIADPIGELIYNIYIVFLHLYKDLELLFSGDHEAIGQEY